MQSLGASEAAALEAELAALDTSFGAAHAKLQAVENNNSKAKYVL